MNFDSHSNLMLSSAKASRVNASRPPSSTKTSPENKNLFHLCYFPIILTRSTFTTNGELSRNQVGVAHKLRKKKKNSPSSFYVLHKTLNVVISRALLFCRGRQRNVPTCKTDVQSNCFCSFNLLFCGVVVAVAVVVA